MSINSINRGDSSVGVISEDGREILVVGGYQGYDIAQVPPASVGDVINGHVDFHKTAWYRFTSNSEGEKILFTISGNNPPYTLRLFDASFDMAEMEITGALEWISEQGIWYLAISPTPEATGDYTLLISN